jgi:hypothetical protein
LFVDADHEVVSCAISKLCYSIQRANLSNAALVGICLIVCTDFLLKSCGFPMDESIVVRG